MLVSQIIIMEKTISTLHSDVQHYYGKELQQSEDLKTNACCTLVAPPKHILNALANVHDEVVAKYYGCGLTIPNELMGLRILDLGSGSGRDCYIAAQLVGECGAALGSGRGFCAAGRYRGTFPSGPARQNQAGLD